MSCKQCDQSNKCRDIIWDGKLGEYHIEVGDGYYNVYDYNVYGIKYCPYCGEDLSKRKENPDKYELTIQQEVQHDIVTFGAQGAWDKIFKKSRASGATRLLRKKEKEKK